MTAVQGAATVGTVAGLISGHLVWHRAAVSLGVVPASRLVSGWLLVIAAAGTLSVILVGFAASRGRSNATPAADLRVAG